MATDFDLPDLLPILSRGKHRNPRKGACFMELASFLAGERWSDHPGCTHPLLAAVARLVNDNTSDEGRQRLAPMIPSVIGLTSDDVRVDARIALRCATAAMPVVAAERQCVMAVSIMACERVLASLDGRPEGVYTARTRRALACAPRAAIWAEEFSRGVSPPPKVFRQHVAPRTVRLAVEGVAAACVHDPDLLLRNLLAEAIDECTTATGARHCDGDRAQPVDDATAPGARPAGSWPDPSEHTVMPPAIRRLFRAAPTR
jgi:hypothetical protein